MPIPDYQTLMLPLLKLASDEAVHSKRDTVPILASQFALTEEEQKELLPSGKQEIFDNRVGWARTDLKKALLIDYVQRGQFRITERGKQVLAENPPRIDNSLPSLRAHLDNHQIQQQRAISQLLKNSCQRGEFTRFCCLLQSKGRALSGNCGECRMMPVTRTHSRWHSCWRCWM